LCNLTIGVNIGSGKNKLRRFGPAVKAADGVVHTLFGGPLGDGDGQQPRRLFGWVLLVDRLGDSILLIGD
jgi:hypothetical protein